MQGVFSVEALGGGGGQNKRGKRTPLSSAVSIISN
jgi:hypothetical protein